jgi:hypothetical protein
MSRVCDPQYALLSSMCLPWLLASGFRRHPALVNMMDWVCSVAGGLLLVVPLLLAKLALIRYGN